MAKTPVDENSLAKFFVENPGDVPNKALVDLIINAERTQDERIKRYEKEISDLQAELQRRETRLADRYENQIQAFRKRESALESHVLELTAKLEQRERDTIERNSRREEAFVVKERELEERRRVLDEKSAEIESELLAINEASQERLQSESSVFVGETVTGLQERETDLSRISFWWSIAGGASLFFGAAVLFYTTIASISQLPTEGSISYLVFFALKGALLAGVFALIARYAYLFSSNYMREALRTADRVHALRFGEFFVKTYGAAASWDQVQKAFENWNAGAGSSWDTAANSDAHSISAADILDALKGLVRRDRGEDGER